MTIAVSTETLRLPEFSAGAALVVGGSGGIGAAICRDLARRGSDVVFSYRNNQAGADALVADIEALERRAHAEPLELREADAVRGFVDAAAARFGFLHSVVYAAGPSVHMRSIGEIQPHEWAAACNSDVNGCFNMVWAALPHLRRQQRGSLLAVITAAVDRVPARDIMSAAPKSAIEMLMRGVAREEGRHGIRANCVGPGWIQSGIGAKVIANELSPQNIANIKRAIPLGRFGTAEEVADVASFLLSDRARYVTGETICVAGGLQL